MNAPDPVEIVAEIHIAAPPERVFQALVDPAQVPCWWGQTGIYRCQQFAADLRVGGKWRSAGVTGDGSPFEVTGEILAVDPPRLLAYTWISSWTGTVKTEVRWELAPERQGTRVRLRHGGFGGRQDLARNYRGWPRMLGWLQVYLEHGQTVDTRPGA